MIDYYYEFLEGTQLLGDPVRYAFQRGYHPDDSSHSQRLIHGTAYNLAIRIWLENSNGLTLVREYGRDVHRKDHPKMLTWLKLQAREL